MFYCLLSQAGIYTHQVPGLLVVPILFCLHLRHTRPVFARLFDVVSQYVNMSVNPGLLVSGKSIIASSPCVFLRYYCYLL